LRYRLAIRIRIDGAFARAHCASQSKFSGNFAVSRPGGSGSTNLRHLHHLSPQVKLKATVPKLK
jgi:hypothetical protein